MSAGPEAPAADPAGPLPAGLASGMASAGLATGWMKVGTSLLPFADPASTGLSLSRLLRLSLFQVTVGMAVVLLIGTLNRVMIVELGVPVWLVATMVSLPLVFAPLRALVGLRSDGHRSALGWRRVPYLWFGTLAQFGGLSIMPFALILLGGDTTAPPIFGQAAAALAFLLMGAGMHTVQTAGLALATDLSPPRAHPRIVALLCVAMMGGMMVSALLFGVLLAHFSEVRLIQVVQGSAFATMALNLVALWKQEPRGARREAPRVNFSEAFSQFASHGRPARRLIAVALGTMGFSMQDVLLEPYGGQVLHLSVSATTTLTAMLAFGGMVGFLAAARRLGRGADPYRFAGVGVAIGLAAFALVLAAGPLDLRALFVGGVALIGLGSGIFAHATLTAAMGLARDGQTGFVLGVWGAVQAAAAGTAVAAGGLIRDAVAAVGGAHPALGPAAGYDAVWWCEVALLAATLLALRPLLARGAATA